ncbi:alpha/beta fold hydrolase [Sphingomonas pituitosa]|uniref:alpha/beta fold hydrolase n=1 Tax=Sphingomonas pituitosa TaxID=99597 RepID=UPI0014717CDF|nr:alpha/beta hydrolase [Sphingomonas pituitosa]
MHSNHPATSERSRTIRIAAAMGVAAAGTALFHHLASRRAEAQNPPQGRFVDVDGVRLHLVDRGSGSTVVLLHGNGVSLGDFIASDVLDRLVMTHRVIAIDRPGFGHSSRPRGRAWTPAAQAALFAKALDTLGIESAVVVGHSWGAMVALALALDHPEKVAGLVLMSGYYYPTVRGDVAPAGLAAVPLAGDVLAHTVSPLVAAATGPAVVAASFAPAPVSPKFERFPKALALRPSQLRAASAEAAMMVPAAASLSRRYEDLDMPIAILAGAGDRIAWPSRHAERLARALPTATLRLIEGEGHLFHYAQPDAVADAVGAVERG